MSSASVSDVTRSQTFQRAVQLWALLMLLFAAALAIYGGMLLRSANQDERAQIEERLEELREHLEEDGLERVIEEHTEEFGALWPAEEAEYHFEDEAVLILLLHRSQPVLGFPELLIEPGWHAVTYESPGSLGDPLAVELTARRVDLSEDLSLIGALPRTSSWHQALAHVTVMAMFFTAAALLGIVVCYRSSAGVLRRLTSLSGAVEAMATGRYEARAVVSPDRSEFDQVAIDINRMLDHIQRLMRNLEDISVGAAHDLKTPLTRLDQRLQVIALEANEPKQVQTHVDAARQHVQTLLTTFNALLRLGEIESGRLRAQFERYDLSALVADVAETFEVVFSDQNRQLSVSVMPNLEAFGDQDLVAQQVANLLENILEHTEAGTDGWIRLQAHSEGALLQVGDEGPGIPAAEQQRVFERFYRVDKSRTKPGNGLGLSLVASIATVHNAKLALHEKQPGCVIDITFPSA